MAMICSCVPPAESLCFRFSVACTEVQGIMSTVAVPFWEASCQSNPLCDICHHVMRLSSGSRVIFGVPLQKVVGASLFSSLQSSMFPMAWTTKRYLRAAASGLEHTITMVQVSLARTPKGLGKLTINHYL